MAYSTINDPSAYFQNVLWTGDGNSTQAITNGGNSNLQPDLIWLKRRNGAENHTWADTSRNITGRLVSNGTSAEDTNGLHSVQSDGFTVSLSYNGNASGSTYVAWQWKANGGTTTNQTGSDIDSVTQANTTSKFAICTYSGHSSASSDSSNNSGAYFRLKHGLGSVPKLAIFKKRNSSGGWYVWHHSLDPAGTTNNGSHIVLNNNTDKATEANILWGNTAWSSTEVEIGGWDVVNRNGNTYIAYFFDEVQGYSKFGIYTGNGSTNGPFIYTGFKPAFVIYKQIDNEDNHWAIRDNARDPDNEVLLAMYANLNIADDSGGDAIAIDFLSNGFKARRTNSQVNASGTKYIYMAFADKTLVGTNNVISLAK